MNDHFHIHTDVSSLPVSEYEEYLEEGFGGVCTGGTAVIEFYSVRRQISKNDLITILPLQLVAIHDISKDFSMTFFKVSKMMFQDIMSGLGKITPDFFFYMRKKYLLRLNDRDVRRFLGFCRIINFRENNDDPIFRQETFLHLLRIYYWDFYVSFQKQMNDRKNRVPNSSKEGIAFKFAMLVFEHHKTNRNLIFYADKLCISPSYLTKVIQEVNGQSARSLIADYVIVEIKKLLRDTSLDIKDVVRATGFATQSSLSRFFRQHTDMSPSEYRRAIHVIR